MHQYCHISEAVHVPADNDVDREDSGRGTVEVIVRVLGRAADVA